MGALSNIIAFDFKKFRDEIIPAFMEGENNELIKREIEIHNNNFGSMPKFENLHLVMQLFNNELTACKYEKRFAADAKKVYEIERKFQRPNNRCWTYESLAYLFESIVIRYCSKYFLSIGKTYSLNLIGSDNINTQHLIDKWSKGSLVWNHGTGGFAEGISGWLNEYEAKELYENFSQVNLKYNYYNSNGDILGSINSLLEICSKENLGVLYGNDLEINLKPHFQYCLILKLNRLENENWDGFPVFENEVIKNHRS